MFLEKGVAGLAQQGKHNNLSGLLAAKIGYILIR